MGWNHQLEKNVSHHFRNMNFKRKSEGEKPRFCRLEKLYSSLVRQQPLCANPISPIKRYLFDTGPKMSFFCLEDQEFQRCLFSGWNMILSIKILQPLRWLDDIPAVVHPWLVRRYPDELFEVLEVDLNCQKSQVSCGVWLKVLWVGSCKAKMLYINKRSKCVKIMQLVSCTEHEVK